MSNAQFSEALSDDPYVKDLHRRAIRVLNDPSLDREQRIELIRQLQQRLLAHQAGEVSKATRQAARGKSKGQKLFDQNGSAVAAPSQVMARRRELSKRQAEQEAQSVEPKRLPQANVKGIDSSGLRSTLTLRAV
jgi:predicted GIY-YIG superfamily endonuclease